MTNPRDRLDEWQELADGISPDMATSFATNGDFDITLHADPDDEDSEQAFTNLHFLRAAPVAVPALIAAVRAVLDLQYEDDPSGSNEGHDGWCDALDAAKDAVTDALRGGS